MSRRQSTPRSAICQKCQSEFQATHSQAKYCSADCSRLGERDSWRKYGRRNAARRRDYHQRHYSRNASRVIERTTAYHKTEAGRQAQAKSSRRQKEINPEKIAARTAVMHAIQAGRLHRQPCERCGETKQIHAHHEDYSKPLDVAWLCPPCHRKRHKELKEVAR